MPDVTSEFAKRGDLAHLALFLWATGATGLLVWALRELAASNRGSTISFRRSRG